MMAYCRACAVRECCRTRSLDNCALCPDQPCEKLVEFHVFSPGAEAAFEALKERAGGA